MSNLPYLKGRRDELLREIAQLSRLVQHRDKVGYAYDQMRDAESQPENYGGIEEKRINSMRHQDGVIRDIEELRKKLSEINRKISEEQLNN